MKWINPTKYALGLSGGSMRGILSLILVIFLGAGVLSTLSSGGIPPGVALLGTLTATVVNSYFEHRNRQEQSEVATAAAAAAVDGAKKP